MEFKRNNVFVRLYLEFIDREPKTLCGFFWTILLCGILLFTSINAMVKVIYNLVRKRPYEDGTFSLAVVELFIKVISVISVVGALLIKNVAPFGEKLLAVYCFLMAIYIISYYTLYLCVVVYDAIYYSIYLTKYRVRKEEERIRREIAEESGEVQPKNIIWESIKALRSKVCPVIKLVD